MGCEIRVVGMVHVLTHFSPFGVQSTEGCTPRKPAELPGPRAIGGGEKYLLTLPPAA